MKSNKPLVYLREFDFTDLSYYKSRKYGIQRKVYKYVGSTDETLVNRTAKWTYKNIRLNNVIGKLLRALMKMYGFKSVKELNKFLLEHTRVLKECNTIEKARITEKTLISINMWEQQNTNYVVCLNKKDAEVKISKDGKYIIK